MKRCSKCKKLKDESKFSKNRSRKDGLRYWCKKCNREYGRNYYRYRRKRKGVKIYRSYEECHRVVGGAKEKQCNICGKWKAESQFYKHRRHKDGLTVCCKECADKATNKARKQRLAVRN
ncbi:hypothetical protein ACFL1G_11810 [Planctomycetota bacterium]